MDKYLKKTIMEKIMAATVFLIPKKRLEIMVKI